MYTRNDSSDAAMGGCLLAIFMPLAAIGMGFAIGGPGGAVGGLIVGAILLVMTIGGEE
jgi:hypothetical protein